MHNKSVLFGLNIYAFIRPMYITYSYTFLSSGSESKLKAYLNHLLKSELIDVFCSIAGSCLSGSAKYMDNISFGDYVVIVFIYFQW